MPDLPIAQVEYLRVHVRDGNSREIVEEALSELNEDLGDVGSPVLAISETRTGFSVSAHPVYLFAVARRLSALQSGWNVRVSYPGWSD